MDFGGEVELDGYSLDNGSSDQCNELTLSADPSTLTCDDLGYNTVALNVEDGSGNISTCYTVVNVLDTLTQLCNAQDIELLLDSNGNAVLNPEDIYTGSGGCGGSSDVSLEVIPSSFDCTNLGDNDVTLIVTDNITYESDTCYAIVTVVDEIAPICSVNNDSVYLDENGVITIDFEDINDFSFDPCGEIIDTMLSITVAF
ncbi:MAG: hypothetical protein R2771_07390 [Saprospiraceae bacterium]